MFSPRKGESVDLLEEIKEDDLEMFNLLYAGEEILDHKHFTYLLRRAREKAHKKYKKQNTGSSD